MARIRTIKPDFWVDEKVVQLSHSARLLFVGLWNFADDEGRMQFSPLKIKMQIFPADEIHIEELFGELTKQGLVRTYQVDGAECLQVINFAKHQKIDKRTASKLPPPNFSTPPEFRRIPRWKGKGNGREWKRNEKGREKPK